MEQIASLSARELEERIALLQAESAQQLEEQEEMWAELQANSDLHAAILQERAADSMLLQVLSTELQVAYLLAPHSGYWQLTTSIWRQRSVLSMQLACPRDENVA